MDSHSNLTCDVAIGVALHIRGTNPVQNTDHSINEALMVIDCCRQNERFDLAQEVLDMLKSVPAATNVRNAPLILKQRQLIDEKSTAQEFVIVSAAAPTPQPDLPPILIRGLNFAASMARWTLSGFAMATEETISKRVKICQACPWYRNERCGKCGCCIENGIIVNKTSLATETCPEGYW